MHHLQPHPLAEAVAKPLAINFYVDGYHSFLLSKEVEALHRRFFAPIIKEFPEWAGLFEFKLSPSKRAILVLSLLLRAETAIVRREEEELCLTGAPVIPNSTVDRLTNPFRTNVPTVGNDGQFSGAGKIYVDASSSGVVFCPKCDKDRLDRQITEFMNSLKGDAPYYEVVIDELRRTKRSLRTGGFDQTQQFYDALGDEIGDVSREGFLKASQNIRREIIEEKGVDGDMIAALADDAYSDAADVFVLLTNDSDHAPLAKRLTGRGKKIWIVGYVPKPAIALQHAVPPENVVNLLTDEREFDFDSIWLKEETPKNLRILDDVRMQWGCWKSQGLV